MNYCPSSSAWLRSPPLPFLRPDELIRSKSRFLLGPSRLFGSGLALASSVASSDNVDELVEFVMARASGPRCGKGIFLSHAAEAELEGVVSPSPTTGDASEAL